MRKIIFCIALSFIISFSFGVNSVRALILLSGDSNITEDLSSGDFDNRQFFTNILQGGISVALMDSGNALNSYMYDFYDGLAGVSVGWIDKGAVSTTALTGVDLYVALKPTVAFTTDEIGALSTFLTGGGSIFFIGEVPYQNYTTPNDNINNALTGLGSSMQLGYSSIENGWYTAQGTQIAINPFTVGVTDFRYGGPAEVSGGTAIFYGSNGEQPFVAYEGVAAATPEPGTMMLLGSGLVGLAGFRRKNKK